VPKVDDTMKSGTMTRGGGEAIAGVWRMTKGNWVSGPNAWLDRTIDWVDEKNMTESMRCDRKIVEEILTG
jgi:hypothetical protein